MSAIELDLRVELICQRENLRALSAYAFACVCHNIDLSTTLSPCLALYSNRPKPLPVCMRQQASGCALKICAGKPISSKQTCRALLLETAFAFTWSRECVLRSQAVAAHLNIKLLMSIDVRSHYICRVHDLETAKRPDKCTGPFGENLCHSTCTPERCISSCSCSNATVPVLCGHLRESNVCTN